MIAINKRDAQMRSGMVCVYVDGITVQQTIPGVAM